MAPSAIEADVPAQVNVKGSARAPLQLSGVLDHYESFDVTPVIGREFPTANLVEWLDALNSDDLLRDLAITSEFSPSRMNIYASPLTGSVSQRGVIFFRAQDDLTNELQKKLILRLGELTGRPATSGLHIHPLLNSERELGGDDPEISTISSIQNKKFYSKSVPDTLSVKKQSSAQWHSDIAFEPVPADYTSLRLVQLPTTGGGEDVPGSQCRIESIGC
jgi:hypothetical protein